MRQLTEDVAARKQAEIDARLLAQRLMLATDAASIGIWDWDLQADTWYASPTYFTMLGYPPNEGLLDRGVWFDRLHPDDKAAVAEKIQSVLAGGVAPYAYEARMRHADGSYRWISVVGRVLEVNEHGKASRLLGVRTDITERKQAVQRVQKLNRVYSVLSDINQTIFREKDPHAVLAAACRIAVEKGRFAAAWIALKDAKPGQQRIAAHAGVTDETLKVLDALLDPKQECSCALVNHALQTGQQGVCNDIATDPLAARWRDAALRRGFSSMASLPLKAGDKVVGTFNLYAGEPGFFDADEMRLLNEVATDIAFALEVHEREARRLRVEHALSESEERFRQLAESIQEVFWLNEPAGGGVLYVSPAYEMIWGRSCASLYESPTDWLDAIHADDRERVRAAISTKPAHGTYDEEYRVVRPDGGIRWVRDRAFPVRVADGQVTRIAGVAQDITAHRTLEEQLRQSQKMEAIGQLAGGVAHDFNNILTVIHGYASLLVMDANISAFAADAAQQIVDASEQAANLTRQLLAFGRRQVIQPKQLDLNDIITGLAKMLQRILGEDVGLQFKLWPHPLLTRADSGMLDQVLMNLVVNARDAMAGGGQLIVESTERTFTVDDLRAVPEARAERYICLRVADTGSGISGTNLPHIFEPFFTTKDSAKGTGLGLATVFGIVKQHGGFLIVKSAVGQGTTFEVFLPADAGEKSADEPESIPAARGGTETILLVEDEAAVRKLTCAVLQGAGYRVLEAPNGVEALQIWDQHHDSIRLLLTDMVMPEGVNGRELAARLHVRDPHLRVVFTSGYSPEIAGRELVLREGENYLQKPASPQRILETVRRSLDLDSF
ncbi:MAG: PAS domain-containing protein [Deltaproteobacteria bacterium]|nr:PAS domain-containing protein [Deltaproteobacteria bacterium]